MHSAFCIPPLRTCRCFWGVELAFARLPGVISTQVGYTGGQTANPTYKTVTTGRTGHAEAVRVTYRPSEISLSHLLDVFFDCHDPTTKNRQGNDVGTQYRSAIFYGNAGEMSEANKAISREEERLGRKVATQLEPLGAFYAAEDYHQSYLAKLGQSDAKGSTQPIRCYG